MRALVLDDDLAIGRLIRRIAAPIGIVTELATEGPEFRALYESAVPDLILLDLQIGDTDGIEQLHFLSEKGYANPLILMSGFDERVLSTTDHVARSLGLKPIAALTKPIRLEELNRVLQSIKPTDLIGEKRLLEAVRQGELVLEYQPVLTAERTALQSLEALVRWEHPNQGRIPPDRFIPIAEKSSEAIGAITDWVVVTASRQYQKLRELGFVAPMAVNISSMNLCDIGLPDRIRKYLREVDMPAEHFSLELTETAAAQDPAKTMEVLSRIRLKGMNVALDDFGTGYSSLVQLRQLPFSALKIDRSFVADVTTSRDSLAIVKATVGLARNMELATIAEGVETEEAALCLQSLGVDALQGYLISRPLPADKCAEWLNDRSFGKI